MTAPQTFADLLTEALWQIKRRDRTSLAVIQDELGYAIGREHGGSVIEYWRKGHLPTNVVELEALCIELHRRLDNPRAWFEAFLSAAHHPYPEGFLKALFPLPDARPSEFRTRPPLHDFVGRESERQGLASVLMDQHLQSPIIVIRGMGGLGKTELAYALIDDAIAEYPDGAIFVPIQATSGSGQTTTDVFRHILQLCDPKHRAPETEDQAALQGQYQAMLSHKRLIIVLDDVETIDTITPLIPPIGSALIITTRRRMTVPGMHTLDLDLLPEDSAIRLITAICPRIGDHAASLAAHCGYLPLALRISASFLSNDDTYPIPLYLEQLAQERIRLDLLRDPDNPNLDVAASLALSIERLDPAVQAALRCLGIFPTSFSDDAAEAVIETTESQQIRQIIGQLRRQHLINYDLQTEQYHLHDLVRVLVWQQVPDPEEVWLRYARYTIKRTIQIQNTEATTTIILTLFDREMAHIRAVWAWLLNQPPTPVIDELVASFAQATSKPGNMRFSIVNEQIPYLRHGAEAARRLNNSVFEGACLINIGIIYSKMAQFDEALAILQDVAMIAAATDNIVLHTYRKQVLGFIYRAQGNFDEAKACLQDVINQDHDDVTLNGTCLGLLGETLRRQGHLNEALEVLTTARTILRDAGDQHRDIAIGSSLGETYADMENFEMAQTLLEEALLIANTLQEDEGRTFVLRIMADVALRQSKTDQALDLMTEAIMVMKDGDINSLHAIQGLRAIILYRQGNREAGLAEFAALEEAITKGGDHWTLAHAGWQLGHDLVRNGDLAQGLNCMKHWITYQRRVDHRALPEDEALFLQLQAQLKALQ